MTTMTTASERGFSPDVHAFAPSDVIPGALLITTSTQVGEVTGDAPAVVVPDVDYDDDVGFTPEGTDITEADPTLASTKIYTGKLGIFAKVSREQFRLRGAEGILAAGIARSLARKADVAYLTQTAPIGPAVTPPAGITLGTPAPTTGDNVAGNLDAVIDAVATIEGAYGKATHVIASPSAWAYLSQFKTLTDGSTPGLVSNVSLVGAGVAAPQRTLLGIPVIVSAAMTADHILILDKSQVLSVTGPVELATDHSYFFKGDSVAIRATLRFGAKLKATTGAVLCEVEDPNAGGGGN